MDKRVKIAVVGIGAVAKKHIAAILELSSYFQLVGLVDSQQDILERHAKALEIMGFNDLEEMLAETDAKFIVLSTPSGLHAQQAITCAGYSRHVIVEKPMALFLQDGLAMQASAQKAKIQLRVVHQHRVNPALQLLKQAIDMQRFGKIFQINCNIFWTRPQTYYDSASWRGSRKLDGGALINQASHAIDLLHWLFGPLQMIQGMWARQARQIETEDSCVLNLRWQQGSLGSLNLSILTYNKNFESSLTVLGEKGTVKLMGLATNEIVHWEFADQKVGENDIVTETNKNAAHFLANTHYHYYTNLIRELENGTTTLLPDGTEGLKTLEILIAAQLAAEQQTTVNLPLAKDNSVDKLDCKKIENVR
ncbi:MAG: Gfo/Idh/MocA family oxidoreductase [Rickettsiella sp.]|nr:Gfo/Idh/MocA family oxidoreductase [Rickettsiella sp.]